MHGPLAYFPFSRTSDQCGSILYGLWIGVRIEIIVFLLKVMCYNDIKVDKIRHPMPTRVHKSLK